MSGQESEITPNIFPGIATDDETKQHLVFPYSRRKKERYVKSKIW
jgi:hypothetical protein